MENQTVILTDVAGKILKAVYVPDLKVLVLKDNNDKELLSGGLDEQSNLVDLILNNRADLRNKWRSCSAPCVKHNDESEKIDAIVNAIRVLEDCDKGLSIHLDISRALSDLKAI